MRVIFTTDTGKKGQNCYINGNFSLVEQFGLYAIIAYVNRVDDAEWKEVYLPYHSNNYDDAVKMFEYYISIYSD